MNTVATTATEKITENLKPKTMDPSLRIPSILGIMIPIIAIVLGIGLAIVSVFLNYRRRKDMFALYHQERMAAIDKGVELPPLPDSFFGDERPRSARRFLRSGLVLLFIGLAVMAALYFGHNPDSALWGLIPVGIGLANLIYYFTEGKKELAEAASLKAAQSARKI